MPEGTSATGRITRVRAELQEAASKDLGDFFQFRIGEASTELQGVRSAAPGFLSKPLLLGGGLGSSMLMWESVTPSPGSPND